MVPNSVKKLSAFLAGKRQFLEIFVWCSDFINMRLPSAPPSKPAEGIDLTE
jgi:hypothetical protein